MEGLTYCLLLILGEDGVFPTKVYGSQELMPPLPLMTFLVLLQACVGLDVLRVDQSLVLVTNRHIDGGGAAKSLFLQLFVSRVLELPLGGERRRTEAKLLDNVFHHLRIEKLGLPVMLTLVERLVRANVLILAKRAVDNELLLLGKGLFLSRFCSSVALEQPL
jgi:hypothetical protein